MTTHNLKIKKMYFQAILDGLKPWECRSTIDRKFEIGDLLKLTEIEDSWQCDDVSVKYKSPRQKVTGRQMFARVTYTYDPPCSDLCVMTIRVIDQTKGNGAA